MDLLLRAMKVSLIFTLCLSVGGKVCRSGGIAKGSSIHLSTVRESVVVTLCLSVYRAVGRSVSFSVGP